MRDVKKDGMIKCKFFVTGFTYRGWLIDETTTHFIVKDNVKGCIFWLPKGLSVVEVVSKHEKSD